MKQPYIRFAERLKELREAAGLSMAELARAIGVSDASICKWENGDAEPKISYVAKLEAFPPTKRTFSADTKSCRPTKKRYSPKRSMCGRARTRTTRCDARKKKARRAYAPRYIISAPISSPTVTSKNFAKAFSCSMDGSE